MQDLIAGRDIQTELPPMLYLQQHSTTDAVLIESCTLPYIDLHDAAISDSVRDRPAVEGAAAQFVAVLDGVAATVSSSDLWEGGLPDTQLCR